MRDCIYLDTTFLLALAQEHGAFRERALELLEEFRRGGRALVSSHLARAELVALIASRRPGLGLEGVYALADYAIRRAGAEVRDPDYNRIVREAQLYGGLIRLRLGSLLHLLAALSLGCLSIATFDTAIIERSGRVSEILGVEVVH
ncbi:hypothetical protein CF15_06895 [Pyrodictium occultum]|uniref:Ribonuclease VapC n=1 Tax=Pyrodictium occultum TaxID=2309 RepID=A0A0V8RWN5_PYROC|nr:PIN domain-containing protein [Pyrodictium occultum]KSW12445.1 hypothetical protein CF15_06895 [Pyrodictium occultum]